MLNNLLIWYEAVEVIEATEVIEAVEVNEAVEVLDGMEITQKVVYDRIHIFGLGSDTETETENWPKL